MCINPVEYNAAIGWLLMCSSVRLQISDSGLMRLAALPDLADARGCFRVTGRGAASLRARTNARVIVLLGDADATAVVQVAAADALAAAEAADTPAAADGGVAAIPPAIGSRESGGGQRGWRPRLPFIRKVL